MKIKAILALTYLLALSPLLLAQEVIPDFEKRSVNPLNEELRKLENRLTQIEAREETVYGTYTGNSVDNRQVTAGFTDKSRIPKFLLILTQDAGGGHIMFSGDASGQAIEDGTAQATGIKSFSANSFVLGTSATANQTGVIYSFIAIG